VTLIVIAVLWLVGVGAALAAALSGGADDQGDFSTSFESNGPLDGRWTVVGADFVADSGVVSSTRVSDDGGQAFVDAGTSDADVSATFTSTTSGSALILRYESPETFLKLSATPEYATWNLVQVEDGEETFLGSTGRYGLQRGTTRVEVRLDGGIADLYVDGVQLSSVGVPAGGGTGFGFAVDADDDGETELDDMRVNAVG
jgi:hypothetical protein